MHQKTEDIIVYTGVAGGLIFLTLGILNIVSNHVPAVKSFMQKLRGA